MSLAIYLLIIYGVALSITYFKKSFNFRGILVLIFSIIPAFVDLLFPNDYIDFTTQVSFWWLMIVLIGISGVGLLVFTLIVPVASNARIYYLIVGCLMLVLIYLSPIHRLHDGWGEHHHFIWETPYH